MEFKVGDKVKLNKNIKQFKWGRGGVDYNDIGTITKISCEKIEVDFPCCFCWGGIENELVLCNKIFFKKLPNNFTGSLEVKNGYIEDMITEILDDKEKEYLKKIIKPFRDRIKYITLEKSYDDSNDVYIIVYLENDDSMDLPNFKKGTMYKNMEVNKEYSLEELGLNE